MRRGAPVIVVVLAIWPAGFVAGCGSVVPASDADAIPDGTPEVPDIQVDAGADVEDGPGTDISIDLGPDRGEDAEDVVPTTGCHIDGTDYAAGEVAPHNECLFCDPEESATEWTPRPDFTRCHMTTSPDRDYDICSGGACVSPGCGTVDCNAPGPNWTLPDTGQRTCFDDESGIAPCPAPADGYPCESIAFCGQDAQYGWDTTHGVSVRFARSTSSSEPTVRDNVSELEWQGCAAGQSGAGCSAGTMDSLPWSTAVQYCENLNWAGYGDWRLPDRYELQTLLDFGGEFSTDRGAFPGLGVTGAVFWSSSSFSTTQAWSVRFLPFLSLDGGTVTPRSDKTWTQAVRCVRSPARVGPARRFQRSEPSPGRPVVLDAATGLVWQGCMVGREGSACDANDAAAMNWREAMSRCEGETWAAFDDWRLPNVMELASLIDPRRTAPAIALEVFPETPQALFWSSTTAGDSAFAWTVDFGPGLLKEVGKVDASEVYVRCVRGGEATE